ncbi:MAG TPA: response regulator [Devosia sp.]|jgi:CheY-like chemotaxis protein
MINQSLEDLRGRRLLIVEDDYMIATDLTHWFEDAGAEVVGPAGSVSKALALVASHAEQLDAAVLDVNLRDEKVFPVAEALSKAGVPFIFATGYDAHIIPETYVEVPRCEKPVDLLQLARLLGQVVGS